MLSSSIAGEENRNKSLKLMEEVWKDINLTSLNEHNTLPSMMTTTSTFEGVIFQDFLGRPFSIDPSNTMVSKTSHTTASSLYCPPSPAPSPVTALSLSSSRPEFHFDSLRTKESQIVQQPQHHHHPAASKVDNCIRIPPFESLVCTSSLPCFGSNRFAEVPADCNPGERRNKRMIKNRESAARSRARKQAYTKELQLKVDHLLEENARLKRQQQQLCEAAASQQKKKNSLYRTSTAPF